MFFWSKKLYIIYSYPDVVAGWLKTIVIIVYYSYFITDNNFSRIVIRFS